ncbi:hypothetical protein MMH89_01105 [Candidatus Comchoanobacter bicostacola]|uniref:Uncharacterized protein n=1 Tax=Candidatus Comchoanobacter bicostacola TaxID=2919598 RepID=A0ABY5DJQ4_9GAMM|nr:hypothetical protein [Candidatus Comchoanobacter bicostacola]UTC24753.1 hypothetical protein MMH89_01105 [Candidatus Comchoanobacter bicostacola]
MSFPIVWAFDDVFDAIPSQFEGKSVSAVIGRSGVNRTLELVGSNEQYVSVRLPGVHELNVILSDTVKYGLMMRYYQAGLAVGVKDEGLSITKTASSNYEAGMKYRASLGAGVAILPSPSVLVGVDLNVGYQCSEVKLPDVTGSLGQLFAQFALNAQVGVTEDKGLMLRMGLDWSGEDEQSLSSTDSFQGAINAISKAKLSSGISYFAGFGAFYNIN